MYLTNMFHHTVATYLFLISSNAFYYYNGYNQSMNHVHLIIRKNTEEISFLQDRRIYRIFRSHSMDLIRSLDTVMKRSWRHTKCDLALTRPFARDVLEFRNLLAYNPSCSREGQFLNFMGILPLYLVQHTEPVFFDKFNFTSRMFVKGIHLSSNIFLTLDKYYLTKRMNLLYFQGIKIAIKRF